MFLRDIVYMTDNQTLELKVILLFKKIFHLISQEKHLLMLCELQRGVTFVPAFH